MASPNSAVCFSDRFCKPEKSALGPKDPSASELYAGQLGEAGPPQNNSVRRAAKFGARGIADLWQVALLHFEIANHFWRAGNRDAAIRHFNECHRLQPDNWTYKRQAWNFEDPMRQGPTDVYDSSWFEDLKKIGAENYYPHDPWGGP